MSEKEIEDEENKNVKITWIDGIPCIDELPHTFSIRGKFVEHFYPSGLLNEIKKNKNINDEFKNDIDKILGNLHDIQNISWRFFEIGEDGKIKEIDKDGEEI